MRTVRIALAAAALLAGSLVAVPPATAATTNVTIDCSTSSATNFEVVTGDVIVFTLNAGCVTLLGASPYSISGTPGFQTFVNSISNVTGTGGSVVADWGVSAKTVTYTAGPLSGVDTITAPSLPAIRGRASGPRLLPRAAQYSMSTRRDAGPAPWFQSYARPAGGTCQATWNPSYAEWPNGGRGGWVCVREYYFTSGSWAYRTGQSS